MVLKRKLEADLSHLSSENEELISEFRSAEERAKKAITDVSAAPRPLSLLLSLLSLRRVAEPDYVSGGVKGYIACRLFWGGFSRNVSQYLPLFSCSDTILSKRLDEPQYNINN